MPNSVYFMGDDEDKDVLKFNLKEQKWEVIEDHPLHNYLYAY